ncbi:MAG: glycerophosphodiester phosphodiesterase [Cytophagales bacterium]|nr:glycerophosphodiester phosphodiesterase [Cytophagales bacterium]
MKYIKVLILLLLLSGCKKINYHPDKPYKDVKTMFLAHKGGGSSIQPENTLNAVKYGLNKLNGVEVDIQLSKDGTIWLSHSASLEKCGIIDPGLFAETTDMVIIEIDSCKGDSLDYSMLKDIFQYIAEYYPEKYISLDVKASENSLSALGILNDIADEIIDLVDMYKINNVMVESETATFLSYLKKNSNGIESYLATFGDFERGMGIALQKGYSGISFKYKFNEEISSDHISLLRKKGLKIQLWTVNSEDDLLEAISINPDFIQTDDIDLALKIDSIFYNK